MDRKFEEWLICILVLGIIWYVYTLGICLISENVKLVPMSMGIYVMIALILAWFFSEKSRLQKAMYRWAIVLACITFLFWGIWWLIFGQVPSNTIWDIEISHWWDILVVPFIVLIFPLFKKLEDYDYLRRQKYPYPKKLEGLLVATRYMTFGGIAYGIWVSHGCLVVGLISVLLAVLAGNALILCGYALFLIFRFIFSTALWKKIWGKVSSWLSGE